MFYVHKDQSVKESSGTIHFTEKQFPPHAIDVNLFRVWGCLVLGCFFFQCDGFGWLVGSMGFFLFVLLGFGGFLWCLVFFVVFWGVLFFLFFWFFPHVLVFTFQITVPTTNEEI